MQIEILFLAFLKQDVPVLLKKLAKYKERPTNYKIIGCTFEACQELERHKVLFEKLTELYAGNIENKFNYDKLSTAKLLLKEWNNGRNSRI